VERQQKIYCVICEKETPGAHKCSVCVTSLFVLFVGVTVKTVRVSNLKSLANSV